MKLTYRGVKHNKTNITVTKVESKLYATYRSQKYTRSRPINLAKLFQRNLTYRGTAYTIQSQAIDPVILNANVALN